MRNGVRDAKCELAGYALPVGKGGGHEPHDDLGIVLP
jgi:hypothetical protein